MEIILFELSESGLVQKDLLHLPELIRKDFWIHLESDDRKAIGEKLEDLGTSHEEVQKWIQAPGSDRLHWQIDRAHLDMPIILDEELEKTDYLTFLIVKRGLITIGPGGLGLSSRLNEEAAWRNSPIYRQLLLYFLFKEMYFHHSYLALNLRRSINSLTLRLDLEPDEVKIHEIQEQKQKILVLSDAVEEQHDLLEIIPSVNLEAIRKEDNRYLEELNHNLDYLVRSLNRMEDRLAAVQVYYSMLVDEKNQHRLNVLTIVQAIFVPISFLAGMYGMNFANMPELGWRYSYFILLGMMVLISAFSLRYFYKNGWFG